MGRDPLGPPLTTSRNQLIAAANEYCRLYERAADLDARGLLEGFERVLPRLHAAAIGLSYSDPDDELPEDDLDVRLTVEERQTADFPVQARLLDLDWEHVEELLGRSGAGALLLDDLSDIYADLMEGFRLTAAGRPEVEADFVWRNGFWSHWGYHSASALVTVHTYVATYLGPL